MQIEVKAAKVSFKSDPTGRVFSQMCDDFIGWKFTVGYTYCTCRMRTPLLFSRKWQFSRKFMSQWGLG